jgi:hypothetical protein
MGFLRDSRRGGACVYSCAMRWLLDKAFGGVVGFVVSTLLGAAVIVLGMTPRQSLAEVFLDPPSWVTNAWTRIAIVVIGVTIIVAASIWKIFSEKRLISESAADLAHNEFIALIDSARKFTSVTVRQDSSVDYFKKTLASDPIFFKLRPRLSKEFLRALLASNYIFLELGIDTGMPPVANFFLRELDRIEKDGTRQSAIG